MKMISRLTGVFAVITILFTGHFTLAQQQSSAPEANLTIRSMVLTPDVVDRQPVDSVQTFSASDSEAFCHIRVRNSGEPTTVTFRWLHNGEEYFTFDAKVGVSSNWRTYSSVTLQPGEWRVQILTPDGEVLTERSFRTGQEQSG